MACISGYYAIVQYLIENGADIEAKDYWKKTSLHIASEYGKTDIVRYLVSKGANKNATDVICKTPSDIACDLSVKSQRDIIKELLK